MSPPDADGATSDELAARDARISELAVGFALGEIQDAELRELYDALREPGERGLSAARVTWQQLGMVTDLRAGMGGMFQDTVKHRIAREGLSDRFLRDSRRRMGSPRDGLSELSAPPGSHGRRWRWLALALPIVAVLGLGAAWAAHQQSQVLCRVTAVTGEATLGGEPLVVGMAVDHRQVVVPAGCQVGLSWSRRAEVTVAGPANVVAQSGGLSLANGAIWTSAADGFVIGLPDDTARIAPGARVAIEVHDGHSTFGVRTGQVGLSKRSLQGGDAATASLSFPWLSYDLQSLPTATPAAPSWSLELGADWRDGAQEVGLLIATPDQAGWRLAWRPGALVVQGLPALGDARTIPIAGAPLGESVLGIVAEQGRLQVSCAGTVLLDEALPTASSVTVAPESRSVLGLARFHSGPLLQPPFGDH